MKISISALSEKQWFKVAKAAFYSFISGFLGGLTIAFSSLATIGGTIDEKVLNSLIMAGVVGGINTLIVYIKQLFTPPSSSN